MPESPLEDDQVDRPDVYMEQSIQLTGTNGRTLGHIYQTLLSRACATEEFGSRDKRK